MNVKILLYARTEFGLKLKLSLSFDSTAEVAHVGTALRSVQLVHQPLLYSANDDGGATAALTATSSGDQGAPQIGQCLAVIQIHIINAGKKGGSAGGYSSLDQSAQNIPN